MEQHDAANGTADGRTSPYMIIQRLERPHRTFLPLTSAAGTVESAALDDLQRYQPRGPLAGGYRLSEDELRAVDASYADAEAFVREFADALSATYRTNTATVNQADGTVRVTASIGDLVDFTAPNLWEYRNYCGPSSMRVALDAIMPQSQLPSIDDIAHGLMFDPFYACYNGQPGFTRDRGIYACAMCSWMHRYILHKFGLVRYQESPSGSSNASALWAQTLRHVTKNYAVITGTNTSHLWRWERNPDQPHVNAIIGYNADILNGWYVVQMYNVRYAETASLLAGYDGDRFKVWRSQSLFWNAVNANNVQCILASGV